jgi:hypothetical protein
MAAVLGVGGYGYQVGVAASQVRADQLEAEVLGLQRGNLELRDRLDAADRQAEAAHAELAQVRERFATEMPSGVAAELLAQLRAQLEAGVEVERLSVLIAAAGLEEVCTGEPETKRFVPRTPISTGPLSYVRFDGRIIVTAEGESALNAAGLPEAWFDATRPVRLEIRTIDGAISQVEGIVPFTHRLVFDGREYRLNAMSGRPPYLEMTAQACALPDPGPDEPGHPVRSSATPSEWWPG